MFKNSFKTKKSIIKVVHFNINVHFFIIRFNRLFLVNIYIFIVVHIKNYTSIVKNAMLVTEAFDWLTKVLISL